MAPTIKQDRVELLKTMKKLFTYIILFAIIVITQAANAQDTSEKTGPKKGRPDIPGTFLIELGFNVLQDAPSLMDVSTIGSRTVNLLYFYDIQIGNSSFAVLPGFGVGLDRYKFDNDITLNADVDVDGNTVVSFSDISDLNPDKSMLIANYFDIPLEFRFYANPGDKKRSFKVGLGAKGGVRFSSHTKLKYEENDETIKSKEKRDFELNRFRYGVTGRIGIGGFNVFYYQSLSQLFDDGKGPEGTVDTSNITIGLSFTGF